MATLPKLTASELRKRIAASVAKGRSGERLKARLRERKKLRMTIAEVIERAAQTGRKVRLHYKRLRDGAEVTNVLEPYSYRTRGSSKGPGAWKFLYGHHGRHGTIEAYLLDNVHGAELTRNYYDPRWPVEIGAADPGESAGELPEQAVAAPEK